MKNNDEHVLQDADLVSPDEQLNGFQSEVLDLDELYRFLDESTLLPEANDPAVSGSTDYGASHVENGYAVSALDDLEELYGVLGEEESDAADISPLVDDSACDEMPVDDSLMKQAEERFADSVDMRTEESEENPETGQLVSGDISASDSLMEELEALFGCTSEPAEAEQPSAEDADNSMTALDELRAFLEDTAQTKTGDVETPVVSIEGDSLANRRSALEEMQVLLESCIEELKVDKDTASGKTSEFSDIEYPSRDELQGLLETALDQLRMCSDNYTVESADNHYDFEELREFISETGDTTDNLNLVGKDEQGEPYYPGTGDGSSVSDNGTDLVMDELDRYMAELSLNTDPCEESERYAIAVNSEYTESELSEDTFSAEAIAAELNNYSAELAVHTDVDYVSPLDDTENKSVSSSETNTLKELEEMLGELTTRESDRSSEDESVNVEDFSYQSEAEHATLDIVSEEKTITAPEVDITNKNDLKDDIDSLNVGSSDNQDANARQYKLGLAAVVVIAAGIYSVSFLLGTGNEKSVSRSESKSSTVDVKPAETVSAYKYVPTKAADSSSFELTGNYQGESYNIQLEESADYEAEVSGVSHIEDSEIIVAAESERPDLQREIIQQKNSENIEKLDLRLKEAEATIAIMQQDSDSSDHQNEITQAVTKPPEAEAKSELTDEIQPVEFIVQKAPMGTLDVMAKSKWTVHLSSFYGRPPANSDLEYLKDAGISYQIKKAVINDKAWYRVIVDHFPSYEEARMYSESIAKNIGRNDIWINKSQ